MRRILLLLGLMVGLQRNAWASQQPFTISNTNIGLQDGEALLGQLFPGLPVSIYGPVMVDTINAEIAQNINNLQTSLNNTLNNYNFSAFLGRTANAGHGVAQLTVGDFISDPSLFSAEAAVGVAVNTRAPLEIMSELQDYVQNFNNQLPDAGIGLGGSGALSMHLSPFHLRKLGIFDPDRLALQIQAMAVKLPVFGVMCSLTRFGAFAQYQIFPSLSILPGGLLRLGGLFMTSGLSLSMLEAQVAVAVPSQNNSVTMQFYGQDLTTHLVWSGKALAKLAVNNYTVPITLGGGLQLGYLLSLYAAASIDFNFGNDSLTATGSSTADITATSPSSGTAIPVFSPIATLNVQHTVTPTWADVRFTAGAQINLLVLALYAQAALDSTANFSGSAGVRAFW